MWQSGLWCAAIALGVLLLVALLWGLHRLGIVLEDRGYIYYRQRSSRGGTPAGVLTELDRLARPSIEHVIEVSDQARSRPRDDEGER